jgi:hypothetical protein
MRIFPSHNHVKSSRKSLLSLSILLLGSFLVVVSCKHKPDVPQAPQVSFSKDVQPVIIANCTMSGCHGSSGGGERERRQLLTYSDVAAIVTPYSPHSSDLYNRITASGGEDKMPPSGYMSEQSIETIYIWILQGAKNN